MAINTVKKPAVPGVNKGSIFDTSPRVAERKIINTPTASKKNTVKFWAMDACLTPRTFNQVMMIAPMTPINAHVRRSEERRVGKELRARGSGEDKEEQDDGRGHSG